MKPFLIIINLFVFFTTQAQPSAEDILSKSIRYHDPERNWATLKASLNFIETRPEGADRKSVISINNQTGVMIINRNDDEIYEVNGDVANVIRGNKGQERGIVLRNYYLYIWGLPMKLQDESTPEITYSSKSEVNGQKVDIIRVAYETDVWYFSFEETTGHMLEYKFYKDEPAGKGELITLKGEAEVKGIKIPKERSWYTLPEMKYLGTDVLERVE